MAIESLYDLAQGNDTPWAVATLDQHSSSEVTAMESFLVPASSEGDEVTPRHTDHLHGLTSFLADDMELPHSGNQPTTIANGRLLSAHTHIADFSELHYATYKNFLNNAKPPTQHILKKPTSPDMAPPMVQRSRRVKYTEAAFPVVVHEQEQHEGQLASDTRSPHMIISTLPSASPPTISSERNIT